MNSNSIFSIHVLSKDDKRALNKILIKLTPRKQILSISADLYTQFTRLGIDVDYDTLQGIDSVLNLVDNNGDIMYKLFLVRKNDVWYTSISPIGYRRPKNLIEGFGKVSVDISTNEISYR